MIAALATRRVLAVLLFAGFAVLPLIATLLGDSYVIVITSRIMVFAIAALSLDLILGYGGLVSFGHAAYLGIGAYAVVILSQLGVTDLLLHLIFAMFMAALFALVTGAISLRTQGIYFIMITLAFAQMAYFFFVSLSAYGGDDGMTLDSRSTLFGSSILENRLIFYYTILIMLAFIYVLLSFVTASRFGRALSGARENPLRMRAIGFSPFPFQLTAYVISGCIASVAGVLLANHANFVSPSFMNWHRSGELVVMVVLGGMGNLLGAVAGATLALVLEEGLAIFTDHWPILFGLILIALVLFSKDGLSGLLVGRKK